MDNTTRPRKYIIVGGVAGGASAAARLRRLDEKATIILLERGEYVSFANCGLPYHAGGSIPNRDSLFLMTPESFRKSLAVDVRVRSEAVAIDTTSRIVTILDRETGEMEQEHCDALVLSPGAEPVRPPIPGIGHPRILTLRSVPDIDRIKEVLDKTRPTRAVVVGAGFIGLEMAENLRERGLAVDVVEALDQVMNVIDPEMAAMVHHHLRDKGVGLRLGDAVREFVHVGDTVEVALASGAKLPADLVILSIGVKPDTKLALEAGISMDERGYIQVDDHLRTNIPWIWAVGDAIVATNPLTGKPQPVPLAGPANKQARIAAENIVRGPSRTWKGAIGTSVAKVFDLTVASTGLSEKACRREGISCSSAIVHPGSHAGYYPEAHPYALKLVWDPESGRILGAQGVGRDGVDKRIDVVASHIGLGATVHQLAEFEHAYAPPYASAKDGTNYAAFVAMNALDGLTRLLRWDELPAKLEAGAFLLDSRTPEEFALGSIPGAINIPHTQLRERLGEVPRDRAVVVYCAVGIRGYLAERVLREYGWSEVWNLTGGWRTWKAATDPQQNLAASIAEPAEVPAEEAFAEGTGTPENPSRPVGTIVTEIVVDACGLQCPGPVLRMKEAVDAASVGSRIAVTSTDPGFSRDAGAWCHITGHRLVSMVELKGRWTATIEKLAKPVVPASSASSYPGLRVSGDEVTLIVFSNDLDRALASFVIANGALATGKKVTMFFTFWGLSVVRRREKTGVRKDLVGRMFDMMLPRHAASLGLSRMNFGGIGAFMMKRRMQAFQVDRLEEMMESARRAGVRMTACQMSMELMGVSPVELMDGVETGGVATYLEAAGTSGINLFV